LNYLDNNRVVSREVDFPEYAITEIYNQRHSLDVISIRTEGFKYIHFKNKEDELYDLKADPGERNNIIKQKPEVAQRFSQMLPPILAQRNEKRVNKVTLDKGTVEELKALGYIQ
jgi:arylsulfatase A-like enzyme